MGKRSPELLCFSETVVPATSRQRPPADAVRAARGLPGRPRLALELGDPEPAAEQVSLDSQCRPEAVSGLHPIPNLVEEWILDLQVLGRGERTLAWYREKMRLYLRSGVGTLEQLDGRDLKRHLAELQARGLAENTVHGSFEVVKAFCNWATREGYPVDPSVLKVRAPKVSQAEIQTYTDAQLQAVMAAIPPGSWGRMAVLILLGTGMRISELCALRVDDLEDDGETTFLKIRKGKGSKFRRVPVSQRLRRELIRYLNRVRPESSSANLLLLPDGRPISFMSAANLFRRTRLKVGFPVHAHRFRHTYATGYLRSGGKIERLMRILGHTTLEMVMRYVHLDKGDLYTDVDIHAPF
jgi:integrase/recombinase XerD